jgi:hypothetical protein
MIVRGRNSEYGAGAAVQALGFTPRQAGFLVLVLEHAGVCLPLACAPCFGA